MDFKEFKEKSESISELIENAIDEGKQIIICCHLDADGLAAGSIIGKSIYNEGGRAIIRTLSELNQNCITNLRNQEYDFYIFTDLGMGYVGILEKELENKWIILDHHQSSKEELEHTRVLNPHEFGIDGGVEISGSGVAYLVAKRINSSNRSSAALAIVGALADRQDQGPSRSLIGINQKIILKDAKMLGLIKEEKDLVFYGRETKPIHEAIASTNTPFIPLLSGNPDACLAALLSSNFKLKDGERWRTISQLSYEEKMKLIEILIPYLTKEGAKSEIVEELFGSVYTLLKEEEGTILRDAREFGSLLNACGRSGKPSIGILICLGDRNEAYYMGEKILSDYRKRITHYLQIINSDVNRMRYEENIVNVIGDDLVDEKMLGAVASIIASSPLFRDKIVIVRTKTKDNDLKISIRRGEKIKDLNIGLIVSGVAKGLNGSGGGHAAAAGAKIPFDQYEKFMTKLIEEIRYGKGGS
ncbi:MAG: DHHA1 domain-containing protein [Nitrososphaeria archaeon]